MNDVRTYRIREYVDFVNGVVESAQGRGVWIEGEIRALNVVRGNTYLDLVDTDGREPCVLKAALWQWKIRELSGRLDRAGMELRVGIKVRIFGKANLYHPTGGFTFKIDDIDVTFTLGDLARQRAELVERLKKNGLYEANRSVEVPSVPLRLGIVTSLDSDARHDAIKELEGSGYGFQVTMFGSLVQGANAPRELSAALAKASSLDLDVILLVRGGGSKSDLAAFDSEEVATAVGHCRHPVFTGIGHERDVSVADEVASRAFKTPTACASAVVEMVRRFVDDIEDLWSNISSTAVESIEAAEVRRAELAIAVRDRTRAVLASAEADLREHRTRLIARPREITRAADARMLNGATRLRLLDPVNTLRRGWSIVRDESGRVVRSVSDVAVGDVMVAQFADGRVRGRVEERMDDGGR